MGNSVCGHPHSHHSRTSSADNLDTGPGSDDGSPARNAYRGKKAKEERYVGAYGSLLGFLEECRDKEVINEARYEELLGAVDDLGSRSNAVSSSSKFFQGNERDFAEVLPALGIDIVGPKGSDAGVQRGGLFRMTTETDLTAVLEQRDFNVRKRSKGPGRDVPLIIHGFMAHYDLVSRYNIDVVTLGAWIEAIGDQYTSSNPYHNWMHAVDVFQFSYLALFSGGAGDFFNFQDVLALLAASIAHDVRHPGVNNAFLISTGSPLAITYNDKSVLENMHASVFFETMNLPGKHWLSRMAASDFKTFRTKVINAILATDMGIHFDLVDKLTARMNEARKDEHASFLTNTKACKERQQASKSDRRMLLQIFMHQADLGHTCRAWDIHKELVVNLEEEFFRQGDQERELGVPLMPLMDRTKDSAAVGQGFFLDKLVSPLLDPFCYFVSPDLGRCFQDNLAGSKGRWDALVKVHGKKTARELLQLDKDAFAPERADGEINSAGLRGAAAT
mmetsp:Transcript_64897/g.201017  ORF Transcript_64897/g.201017 Transcript_64897/m.201017 type:complete len:504 (+) Transcript_64897:160-1671(+)